MQAVAIPRCMNLIRDTVVGIAAVVFLFTIVVTLCVRPPSVMTNSLEGVHINWWKLLSIAFAMGASVFLYPLFVRVFLKQQKS